MTSSSAGTNRGWWTGAFGALAVSLWVAGTAQAQEAAPATGAAGAVPSPPPEEAPPPPPPAPLPGAPVVRAAPPPATPTEDATSDFNVEARRWAVGYSGVSSISTGSIALAIPAIGIRYWANQTIGLDLALGLGWAGGSVDSGPLSMDKNAVFGILFQGGIPVALSTHRHVSFQVIPYLTVAHGQTSSGTGPTKVDFNGLRLDVGARVGLEVFFGFIGIPELALSATIGAQFEYTRTHSEGSSTATVNADATTDTTYGFITTVQNNPWDLFTSNVAARYYF